MTLACRFPDRVRGVISIDAAPVKMKPSNKYRSATVEVIEFMHRLRFEKLTATQARQRIREHFSNNPYTTHLIESKIDPRSNILEWNVNIESIYEQFDGLPFFDTDQYSSQTDHIYHVVGGKSYIYPFEEYTEAFPNTAKENVEIVEGAGHWVHIDKPLECLALIQKFLAKID